MAKKINEKTSGIDLSGFQPRNPVPAAPVAPVAKVASAAPREAGKSYTGAGIFMSAITGKDELARDLAQTQQDLAAAKEVAARFAGAEVVRLLDPHCVRPSHWANRNEASFQTPDYARLKDEIEHAGGNVQPIKVRPLPGQDGQYEIVFGHRRHRACLDVGVAVRAQIETLSDAELFAQMDRENRQRADLRPYEQGHMYAKALDEGLFSSLRKMADALGVDAGNASKAIALARLPDQVLAAFGSPLELQQAWATPLAAAMQKNPDQVLSRARELAARTPRLPAAQVVQALLEEGVVSNNTAPAEPMQLRGKGGTSASIAFNPRTRRYAIKLVGLDASAQAAVEKAIRQLLG